MRKVLVFILILCIKSCSPKKNTRMEFTKNPIPDTGIISSQGVDPGELFSKYSDSVNHFQNGKKLPEFLFNAYLDYENPWLTDHNNWSIRKMIFDSTRNLVFLQSIITSKDVRLKEIPDSNSVSNKILYSAIPYTNLSNFELAKKRLSEIKKSKKFQ